MPLFWEPRTITLKVRKYAEVRSFYKAVLSLKVVEDEPGISVAFDLGNILLILVRDDLGKMPNNFGKTFEMTFIVRNLNEILEGLHKLNVEYEVERISEGQKLNIQDPEGRIISFITK